MMCRPAAVLCVSLSPLSVYTGVSVGARRYCYYTRDELHDDVCQQYSLLSTTTNNNKSKTKRVVSLYASLSYIGKIDSWLFMTMMAVGHLNSTLYGLPSSPTCCPWVAV